MSSTRTRRSGGDGTAVTPASSTAAAGKQSRTASIQRRAASPRPPALTAEQREMFSMQSAAALDRAADAFGWDARPVQARGALDQGGDVHDIAEAGVSGSGQALPHLEAVQRSFGRHVVSDVRAHLGGDAARASTAIGAEAYATGRDVAFATPTPSLDLVAHEAAHVVQQRAGVSLKGGVGASGDAYEQHADRVAAAVVAGQSAEPILDEMSSGATGAAVVQRREQPGDATTFNGVTGHNAQAAEAADRLTKAAYKVKPLVGQWKAGQVSTAEACTTVWVAMAAVTSDVALIAWQASKQPAGDSLNEVFFALDVLAEAAATLRIAAEADPAAFDAGASMTAVAGYLATAAEPLGWVPPLDPTEAKVRQREQVACDAENTAPDSDCYLPVDARHNLRSEVEMRILQVIAWFGEACEAEADTLSKAIARDQAIAEALAEIAVTLIAAAFTGVAGASAAGLVTGAVAPDAKRAASRVGRELAKAGINPGAQVVSALSKGAKKAAESAWKAAKADGKGRAASVDPRKKTVSAVGVLRQSFADQAYNAASDLGALSDSDLMTLKQRLASLSRDQVDADVGNFVNKYRTQIEPIGEVDPVAGSPMNRGDLPGTAVRRAVTVLLPNGHERVALVTHVSDLVPQVRHAGRWLAAGIADVVDPNEGHDGARNAWVAEDVQEYNFERWIDRSMEPFAGDAPRVDASQVTGLPLPARVGILPDEES